MFGNNRSKRDMSTCWISDPAGSKCAASGGGGGRGLTVVEGVAVDGGGVREQRPRALSPRLGERAGNPSRAGVKLQDEQLRLRGGQVRGRRHGIRFTLLAEGAVDGGGVGEGGGRHCHRSPGEEDGVERRPRPDPVATDGAR